MKCPYSFSLEKLAAVISAAMGRTYRLTPLKVKCTYPVFKGEAREAAPVFVKVGTREEWTRTSELLKAVGKSRFFAGFITENPIDFEGAFVFVMEWRASQVVFPEDMNLRQIESFVAGCVELGESLQGIRGAVKIAPPVVGSPEELYGELVRYVEKHPLAGRLLKELVEIPVEARTYGEYPRAIIHGDFHAKNFGFVGDELTSVFDFDKVSEGLPCGDFVNALVERFSCLGLSASARLRLLKSASALLSRAPWPREELIIAINLIRLQFAVRRIRKHPRSAWVAFDIARRDRAIRAILPLCSAPHARLLVEQPWERVGWGGTRRVCYKLGNSGFCVKFYKPEELYDAERMKPGIRREIARRRFGIRRNSSSLEVAVYENFWLKQAEDIRAKLPPVVERVFDAKLGWGILETYYTNPDGTAIIPYEFEIKRQPSLEKRREIYDQARDFLDALARIAAPFYEPGNFHTLIRPDGGFETKLIDFEPIPKMAIPLVKLGACFRRLTIRRKARHYLRHIRETYLLEERLDERDFRAFLQQFDGSTVTRLQRVRAGNSSQNWLAQFADSRELFIKWVPESKRINLERTLGVLSLEPHGLLPELAWNGSMVAYHGGFLIGMARKDGSHIPFENLSRPQAEALVRAYATFSRALQAYRGSLGESRVPSIPIDRQRIIHGDLNCANVLFQGDSVSAFVDFEMVRRGLPTEDLVRGFIHRSERLPFLARSRRRRIAERFAWVVSAAAYSAEEWQAAIEAYRQRKVEMRLKRHTSSWIRAIERIRYESFYRRLAQIVGEVAK